MHKQARAGVVLLVLCLSAGVASGATLQRITVTETNNYTLGREFTTLRLPESTRNPAFDALRRYYRPAQDLSDWQSVGQIVRWVHQRWQHDPFGSAPPQTDALTLLQSVPAGAVFSCTEFSRVLRDMLRANGFIARTVTLQSRDIAYSGLGGSHVAVEVHHSQLDKWVLVDAQWGFAPVHNGQLLNIYDIHRLKHTQQFDAIDLEYFGDLNQAELAAWKEQYKDFLGAYLGYLTIDLLSDNERVSVIAPMEGDSWPLTFQGLPRNAQIFARRIEDQYFDVNRVSLSLRYRPESQPLNRKQIEFTSAEDYLQKMPQFAAVPDFIVTPHHNMPWFAGYEYRIDKGKWTRLTAETFPWKLRKGVNRLEVRAFNSENRRGPITYIQIEYK